MYRVAVAWFLSASAWAGTAELSWTAPTLNVDGTPITLPLTYRAYRACDGGPTTQIVETASLSYSDTVSAQTCSWWVSAVTADGESARTGPVSKALDAPGIVSATFSWTIQELNPVSFTYVSISQLANDSGSTSLPIPAFSVTTGNLLVVVARWEGGGASDSTTVTWSDGSNTYELAGYKNAGGAGEDERVGVWYSFNVTGGASLAITGTLSTSRGYLRAYALQYSYTGSPTYLALADGASSTNVASWSTSPSLPYVSGDLIVAAFAHYNGAGYPMTPGSPLGSLRSSNGLLGVADYISVTSSSTAFGATPAANDSHASIVVKFGESAAAASLPPINNAARMAAMIAH